MPLSARRRNHIVKKIASLIHEKRSFFLSGHRKPDGDTVGSELAMESLLRRLGKSVDVYNAESVPESLLFLPGARRIRTARKVSKNYDAAVIFECFDSDRMGNIIDLKKQAEITVNIDHHILHSHFGDINLINTEASSNSEQLFYLFEELGLPITKDEAACLYTGIMADTGRFQHSNTNAETLRIASNLVRRGANPSFLCEKIYGTRNFSSLKLLGFALSTLTIASGNKIAYAKIRQSDFKRTRSSDEETEEIVNYGLQVPSVLISLLLRETSKKNVIKASLRSRRNVNVCDLAQRFGGGGHKYASGCRVEADIDTVLQNILARARQLV